MTVPLRAALYLRVSTARQVEHDVSIPDQRRQGEAYCGSRGYQQGQQGATLDGGKLMQYDGAIMMAKTQITLGTEMQRRARQRANDLGVSLAEYFRRLVARDLARPETATDVDRIFDLGSSGGSDIASQKDSVIAEAFHSTRRKLRRL
jgi:hypothetical protein